MTLQTPLRFPFIRQSTDWVRWCNAVLGRSREIGFTFKEQAYRWTFLPAKPAGYDAKVYLKIHIGKQPCTLGLGHLPSLDAFHPSLKGVPWTQLAPDVLAVILEGLGADLFKKVQAVFQAEVSLQEVSWIAPKEVYDHAIYFSFAHVAAGGSYPGHLWLGKTLAGALGAYVSSRLPCAVHPAWAGLPVRGRIILGGTRLSQKDFLALAINDIVLLDNQDAVRQGEYTLAWGQSCFFAFNYKTSKATVIRMTETPPYAASDSTSVVNPQEQESSTRQELEHAVTHASAPVGLDAVPVDLVFELGTRTLTLQELKSIAPGYTFELENPVQKPVQVRLRDGGLIGVGELLDIGGRVGVRLVELLSAQ